MSGFIIPKAAVDRPDLVPLGVEWPAHLIGTNSEGRQVSANGIAHPLIDVTLAITAWDTEDPIHFEVRSDDWAIAYSMTFSNGGPEITADGADAEITSARGWTSLASFMNSQGLTVYFEQEALVSPLGYFLQPDRSRPRFPRDDLEPVSWHGTNIRSESQGPDRDATSVQFRAIELLRAEAEWDIVIDDDGPGETADIVLLKVDDQTLRVVLCHCKYSGGDSPGSRVGDLYEVCGQSQKSYKARSEIELILKKLIRREQHRQAANRPGLIVGDLDGLLDILDRVHVLDVAVTVVIAQPGLSKSQMSIPQAELLACTAHYLSDTYGSRLRVLCSE